MRWPLCVVGASALAPFDVLLSEFRDAPLAVAAADPALPAAVLGPPGERDVAADLEDVRPGGVAVVNVTGRLIRGLWQVARYQAARDPALRRVKLAIVSGGAAALLSKGVLDDNDHMCLGDLGKEYGEYRWGVFSRFLARMVRHAAPEAAQYFSHQMAVFDAPISEVRLRLGLPHHVEGGEMHFATRDGAERHMAREAVRAALLKDLSFALAIHPERISVAQAEDAMQVTIADVANLTDFDLHRKMRPWKTWRDYFGESPPQPLVVVAQTAREKSLMVDDDLSDFYKGSVTAAVPEGDVKVSVVSPACEAFADALSLHQLQCIPGEGGVPARAPTHSPLYRLAAKEKLDGALGTAAEASLRAIHAASGKPWPPLMQLVLEPGSVVVSLFEGRLLRKAKSVAAVAAKLPRGVDVVHIIGSCEIPASALAVLVPGGVVLLEHMPCPAREDAFAAFVDSARGLGDLAVGRNIAVVVKPGVWEWDERRASWPQAKLEL